ncbi:MAG: UDP-N-acetylmuramate dehydrogenase, partial [Lachnospiraceae bacterium]|nr:UDP-N-acetylmuramate dehydrogenase [Lachnospiraceae bacterium]
VRIGGPAAGCASPATLRGICEIVRVCRELAYPFYVVGNGSNLLVSDQGYRGLVLQLYKNWNAITVCGTSADDSGAALCEARAESSASVKENCGLYRTSVSAGLAGTPDQAIHPAESHAKAARVLIHARSGAMLSVIAKRALEEGLTGFEFASGIPGTLGGAVVMNAGAYGGEMKDVLVGATVLTQDGKILEVPAEALELGYRRSAVIPNGWIVLEAKLSLSPGDPEMIRSRMEELKQQRQQKQPLDLPSAGSTFKRPEGYFAGKLIMDAGLRGYTVGGTQVSEKHCGFVVNRKDAKAEEVLRLMKEVPDRGREQFGVTLEPEIRMLGDFD